MNMKLILSLGLVLLFYISIVNSNALRSRQFLPESKSDSVLINGSGWKNARVDVIKNDNKDLSDEDIRKYLAMLKNHHRKTGLNKPVTNLNRNTGFDKQETVVSNVVKVLDPLNIQPNFLTRQVTTLAPTTTEDLTTESDETTTEADETTTEADETTTEEQTTENPNNFPKSGDIELLVENIVYSGYMFHWSVREQYLAISDIWGQKYLRFEEIPPATTTVVPDTTIAPTEPSTNDETTETVAGRIGEDTTTTEATTTAIVDTTTETPTTTVEPLPYDIKTMEVSKDVVFLLQPNRKTEGTYPLMIPLDDYSGQTEFSDDFIMAFGGILHIGHWDLSSSYTNMTNIEWHNTVRTGIDLGDYNIPSPAWVDPTGKIFIGTTDLRHFEKTVSKARFSKLPNSFESTTALEVLSKISCKPNGMAWSPDNSTLYFSDGHTKDITKCSYDVIEADASNCSTVLNVKDEVFETAVPHGIATDENNHIWVAVAHNDGKGAVIEIDPETNKIISTIDLEDADLVDVVFAGEDLDFMYILSNKNLYKMTGLGVTGMHVPDFVWDPDAKKRSINLNGSWEFLSK